MTQSPLLRGHWQIQCALSLILAPARTNFFVFLLSDTSGINNILITWLRCQAQQQAYCVVRSRCSLRWYTWLFTQQRHFLKRRNCCGVIWDWLISSPIDIHTLPGNARIVILRSRYVLTLQTNLRDGKMLYSLTAAVRLLSYVEGSS